MTYFFAEIANEKVKSFSEIPTPKGLPFIGAFFDITKFRNFDVKYMYDFTRNRHKQLGPIYRETAFLGKFLIQILGKVVFILPAVDPEWLIYSTPVMCIDAS